MDAFCGVCMKTIAFIAAVVLLLLTPEAYAQEWAKDPLNKSPRHLEWITVKCGQRDVKCFVAFPQSTTKATAVVVVHEIFGLSDWVRSVTDKLAEEGYIAIAPDLLSGTAPGGGGTDKYADVDAVRKAVSSLSPQQVKADLQGVSDYVCKLPAANGKIAVAGFCWGGAKAFQFATEDKKLKASFVFYGNPPATEDMPRITAPVYGFYGEKDERINATIEATAASMKRFGKQYDSKIYKGAGHGFMRAGQAPDGSADDKAAKDEAWKRWLAALKNI